MFSFNLNGLFYCCVFILLLSFSLIAHPGYGIITDEQGNIYFTDISRRTIWKLDKAGNLSAIATSKWSHQVWIDDQNNLYFTDEEDVYGRRGYSLWRFSAGGGLTELSSMDTRANFPGDMFVLDKNGILYAATGTGIFQSDDYNTFYPLTPPESRSAKGTVTFLAIRSLTIGFDGLIYIADGDKIKRIRGGTVETLVSGLLESDPPDIPIRDAQNPASVNRLFGVTTDADGVIYVCYFGNRQVLKIAQNKNSETFYKSPEPWSPVGVAADKHGIIVKEHGFVPGEGWSGPRIIRIKNDKKIELLVEVTN